MSRRMFRKSLSLENLEVRQLLDAAGADLVRDSFVVEQNQSEQVFDVLANDQFDEDYAGSKVITSTSLGSLGGRIRIAEDGKRIHYTPPADGSRNESFTYFVDQDHLATVAVRILAPLRDDKEQVNPDRDVYRFDVLENDPFWEGYQGARKITLVSASTFAAGVEITDDGTSITYTRKPYTFGTDTITYIVDGKYPANLQIQINDPLQDDQREIVQFDPAVTYNVVANDPFWPGYLGAKQITHVLDIPEGATAEKVDGGSSIRFDGSQLDSGYYRIRYVIDGKFESTLTVVVQRPVRDDYGLVVDKNSSRFEFNLLGNDTYYSSLRNVRSVDVIDRITSVSATEQGALVTVTSDGQGVFYTPPTDYVGPDTFTYTADGKHVATAHVTVRDFAEPTVNRDDYFSVNEGTVNNRLSVLANDFFGDGYEGPRTITNVAAPENGTVSIAASGNYLIYTPNDDASYDTFTYEIDGTFSATVRVGIGSITRYDSYEFDVPRSRTLTVLDNDRFSTGSYPGGAIITSVTQPDQGGVVAISASGKSLTFEPGIGSATFTYTVDNRFTETVTVFYHQRLSGDYFVVDQNGPVTEFDVLENDFHEHSETRYGSYRGDRNITSVRDVEHGTVAIAADGKSISYVPDEDYVGSDQITYVVDGYLEATVSIDVTKRLRHDRVHVDPNSANNVIDVLANDLVSGDYEGGLRITGVTSGNAGATVAVDAEGKHLVYSPTPGFTGVDTIEYTVDDQLKANVTVEVNADVASLYPKFGSLDAFKGLVLDTAKSNLGGGGGDFIDAGGVADLEGLGPSAPNQREHSETNVQVEGVDEADLIETDSDHLYVLTHGQLVINKAWPADAMEVLSRTEIKGAPIGQYLYGDRIAVVSQEFNYFPWFEIDAVDDIVPADAGPGRIAINDGFGFFPGSYEQTTYITVLDVADRSNPTLVQRIEVEGAHVQTRRIDDYVYLVVREANSLRPERENSCEETDNGTMCTYETDEEYLARIESNFEQVVDDLLPSYESYGPDGMLARTGLLVQPEDIFQPLTEGASKLISVVGIDITNDVPGLASTTGVLTSGGEELYVTADNLYVFENRYNYVAWWAADADTAEVEDSPTTEILKFNLNRETGGVDFAASGQVPGRMLNQFSADEYNGHLRIATSVSNWRTGNYSQSSENALFVLRDDMGVLEHVGTIQNLALNETIQSVRFFGDRAVVTTFQTIDPLFSLDLSDPENPHVEGHLTLPGFASYMQFVDQDRLLTIGRSSATGFGGALAISLFNVSDIEQPILVDQFNWDNYSSSPAAFDHHAFGWFASHDTLAIPSQTSFTAREDEDGDGYAEKVINVTEYELQAFGIDTIESTRSDSGISFTGTVAMGSPLLRSAYIDDKLYAVATDSIKSTNISDPSTTIAELAIRPDEEPEVTEVPDPRLAAVRSLQGAARQDLARRLQVAEARVLTVATEAALDETSMVLRVGDEQYVYHGTGDRIELQRSDFRAVQVGDYHNSHSPFDVDGNGIVTPRDVLYVINALNDGQGGNLSPVVRQIATDLAMVDTSNDGYLSPIDALNIINFLNSRPAGQLAGAAEPTDLVLADIGAALDD